MRNIVFGLAILQVVVLIAYYVGCSASDAAGNAMSSAFVTFGAILMVILTAPAVIMAVNRTRLTLAMWLVIISTFIVVFGLAAV